jgi:hypothetical protein
VVETPGRIERETVEERGPVSVVQESLRVQTPVFPPAQSGPTAGLPGFRPIRFTTGNPVMGGLCWLWVQEPSGPVRGCFKRPPVGFGDVEVLGLRTLGVSQNGDAQWRKFAHFFGFGLSILRRHMWPHRRHSQASIFFICFPRGFKFSRIRL